ncbi:hypothetical protein [Phocaeicola paurosaccharolyticus]|uniref:hypothetical protein n=1 Tax=Phocaeicola paurosaccharolyticus TaxID=732242 RepID=UPI002FE050EB
MKNINNARVRFKDAVQLRIRIDKEYTPALVRSVIPSSVTIISCKITKNYATVIYSEQANHEGYPDVTKSSIVIHSKSEKFQAAIATNTNSESAYITTNFNVLSYPAFIKQIEMAHALGRIISISKTAIGSSIDFKLGNWEKDRDNLFEFVSLCLNEYVDGVEPIDVSHTDKI